MGLVARISLLAGDGFRSREREGVRDRHEVRLRRHAAAVPDPRPDRADDLCAGERSHQPGDRQRAADDQEGDLDIVYNVQGIKGLSLRFRNAYVDRGNPQVLKEFRLIVNYDLNLL